MAARSRSGSGATVALGLGLLIVAGGLLWGAWHFVRSKEEAAAPPPVEVPFDSVYLEGEQFVMEVHLPWCWLAEPEPLALLDAKIAAWRTYVLKGELARAYPETEERPRRLRVVCTHVPTAAVMRRLQTYRTAIAPAGMDLKVRDQRGVAARLPMDATSWQERLLRCAPTRSLAEVVVIEAVAERFKRAKVEREGDLEIRIELEDGFQAERSLYNVWGRLRQTSPSDREAVIERTLDAFANLETDAEERGPDRIRPLVRGPGETPSGVKRKLAGDLFVYYVFDRGDELQFLIDRDRRRLELTLDQLHETAVANLQDALPEIEKTGSGSVFLLACGGTWEASLLLLDHLWGAAAAEVSGDLVACVPASNVLLYTGSKDAAGLRVLREQAESHAGKSASSVSRTLLRWTGAGWGVFEG